MIVFVFQVPDLKRLQGRPAQVWPNNPGLFATDHPRGDPQHRSARAKVSEAGEKSARESIERCYERSFGER